MVEEKPPVGRQRFQSAYAISMGNDPDWKLSDNYLGPNIRKKV